MDDCLRRNEDLKGEATAVDRHLLAALALVAKSGTEGRSHSSSEGLMDADTEVRVAEQVQACGKSLHACSV